MERTLNTLKSYLVKVYDYRFKFIAKIFDFFVDYESNIGIIQTSKQLVFKHNEKSYILRFYNKVMAWPEYGVIGKEGILSEFSFVNTWDADNHVSNKLFRNYPAIKVDGISCIIDTPYSKSNYYHFYIESLPRLWFLKCDYLKNKKITLLLPYKRSSQVEALIYRFHDNITIKYIPECYRVESETFIELPFMSKSLDNFNLNSGAFLLEPYLKWFKLNYSSIINANLQDILPSKNIYISRRDAKVRKFKNEAEIEDMLIERFNIEIVVPGEMSIKSQAELFHNSKFIISPHGAGLTNLIWCQKTNGGLLEIFPSKHVSTYEGFKLHAQQLGFRYDSLILEGTNRNDDVIVDIESLSDKVKTLIDYIK